MKRDARLRSRDRFEEVRRQGQCWPHRLLVVCCLPNHLAASRFGFSASKRIGNAVVRNRARRRLREIVRVRLAMIAPGWDVVLIARPPLAQARFSQIETAVERLFKQAGLFSLAVTPAVTPAQPTSYSPITDETLP